MSKNIRIVLVLLTVVLVFLLYMIIRFYNNVETAARINNSGISSESGNSSGFTVFEEGGLKGLKNGSGQIIIPARWSKVISASAGKYIVSKTEGKTSTDGVIDISENIIIPLIYKKIVYDRNDSYYVCTTEDGRYVLNDENGKALVEKEWEKYQKKIADKPLTVAGNYVELQDKDDSFRFCRKGEKFLVIYINLVRDLCGCQKQINIRNAEPSLRFNTAFDCYCTVVDNAIGYINAMFTSDIAQRKKLTIESEYRDPPADEVDFRGGDLRYIETVQPYIEYRNGQFSYSCNVSLMYAVPESINFDGSYSKAYKAVSMNLQMKREQDGFIRISSVKANKIDISTLEIPDECFDPEEEPVTTEITDDISDIPVTELIVQPEVTSAAVIKPSFQPVTAETTVQVSVVSAEETAASELRR